MRSITLLWLFWHAVLSLVLMKTAGKWEAPVLSVLNSVQALLLTMVLGIYVMDTLVGSNPFAVLLREHPEFANLPFLANADYLDSLDGRGLNPLLQNYWMTIHPPTLFLGFALVTVPFAYAIAGLWTNEFKAWMKPALPWAFTAVGILGVGILMGGAWAYESLTFGGFWAWDPVENSSLVPWLILVGAAHLLLIQRNKGTSLFFTFLLSILAFIMVLYSTFLTKSGILGDSSVHAFTDLGLSGQLVFYLAFYSVIGFGLLIAKRKELPKSKSEEALWSREFWMFVGAMVLSISAFQILFTTSIPVWNTVFQLEKFDLKMAPPIDAIAHYNQWQLPFAVLVLFLVGFTQFLRYRDTPRAVWFKPLISNLIVSLALTIGFGLVAGVENPLYLFMQFAAWYAVVANAHYLFNQIKLKQHWGSSIAHVGFGLVMLGSVVANGEQDLISENATHYDLTSLDDTYKNNENILLMLGDTLPMGDYKVTYTGKQKDGIYVYYNVKYFNQDGSLAFELNPFIQLNAMMGNVREPSTKHFWNKDIYTYLSYAEIDDRPDGEEAYKEPTEHMVKVGDTLAFENALIIFNGLQAENSDSVKALHELKPEDLLVAADITLFDFNTNQFNEKVYFGAQGLQPVSYPKDIDPPGLRMVFKRINPEDGTLIFDISAKKYKTQEFIIMQAIEFPFINILWIGIVVMALGSGIAVYDRIKMQRS